MSKKKGKMREALLKNIGSLENLLGYIKSQVLRTIVEKRVDSSIDLKNAQDVWDGVPRKEEGIVQRIGRIGADLEEFRKLFPSKNK